MISRRVQTVSTLFAVVIFIVAHATWSADHTVPHASPQGGSLDVTPDAITLTSPPGWHMQHADAQQCPGSAPLIIEIGSLSLAVPRSTGEVVDVVNNGIKDQLPHTNEHIPCNLAIIHNAWHFGLPGFDVYLPNRWFAPSETALPFWTQYDLLKNAIRTAHDTNAVRLLGSGIQKIPGEGVGDIFLLPTDKSPTGNGQPIALNCNRAPALHKITPMSFCSTIYLHPSGLMLSYRFPRDKYPADTFLDADAHYRALLGTWLRRAITKGEP